MVTRLLRLAVVAVLAVVTGCSSVVVDADYDTSVDFSHYRTWSWRADEYDGAPSKSLRNSLVDRRIRPAVERHMATRGFQLVDAAEADFHVAYQVGVEGKLFISTWDHGGYRRRGWGGSTTQVTQYKEGALVLAILDSERNEVVWQGTARAVLDPSESPESREARVDEAVSKIVDKFPPGRE